MLNPDENVGRTAGANREQMRPAESPRQDQLEAAKIPELDRRSFLSRVAAASAMALGSFTAPATAMVQADPERSNKPGIDSPLDMSRVTITGPVYDNESTKKPIDKAEVGRAASPSLGGALQLAALAVERVGRDNIPSGHVLRISVNGTRGEHIFMIDPAKVPSSDFSPAEYVQSVKGPERDPELARFVESLGRDKLGVQLFVSRPDGNLGSVEFAFLKDKFGTPASLSVQFVAPAKTAEAPR